LTTIESFASERLGEATWGMQSKSEQTLHETLSAERGQHLVTGGVAAGAASRPKGGMVAQLAWAKST